MSCTSSPSRTSFGEQTIFAFQDLFVLPSDVTAGRTSAADASHYGRTFTSGNGSPFYTRALNVGANVDLPGNNGTVDETADYFDEESNETYSSATYPPTDKDLLFFNNSTQALPIIESDFFEDADACTDSPVASYQPATKAEQAEEEDIFVDDVPSYDLTENIEEALEDIEIRSQDNYFSAEFSQSIEQETLLQVWQYDYQRHEWIALKFHQPPYTTEAYSVPYTTEHQ
ncbi:hypothetical protein ONS95_001881 [Cadophora gregata]|uniref:uncharacterized protein n=1 Tax=Cadophora gregata TaxID=51156 RepID=UPI0026DB48F6|nr:uncharacterized protein ONS95_001881 [Cadophora gregata]KAK0111527.1 hypothetical protein ONS95_001881 [Cadophora gregata]KAK0111997.1 hypothetical protein ONS96_001259 [Cadophora gregata f. sp. sojae]